jgi:hypothetical protein
MKKSNMIIMLLLAAALQVGNQQKGLQHAKELHSKQTNYKAPTILYPYELWIYSNQFIHF